jgi:putative ABC transport system permease protein
MGDLRNDIKHSLQMFFKNPGFTIAAVSALALGIGASAAIFTVVNAVLIRPLPYPNADRIVEFLRPTTSKNAIIPSNSTAIPEFHAYRQQTGLFQEIAAYDFAGLGFNLTGERSEQIQGIHVTAGYFRLFGAQVILGRTFTTQEDSPNGGKVVVLSYGLWQRKFGGDPSVVGKSLSLSNEPHVIIGVLGRQFLSDPEADIWLPFQFEPVSNNMNHYFQVAGLLRPGITLAQANAKMRVAGAQFLHLDPKTNPRQIFAVEPLRDSIVGDVRGSLLLMLGAVSLVLLIACANVANLLLVRATGRQREFAIRSVLGAGRARIVRQLLTESVLLSISGGILGLALGFVGVRALLTISPAGLPRVGENGSAVGVDWRVLAFTLSVSLVTGVLFGLFPACTASQFDLNSAMKASANRSGTGFREGKTRSLLIVSEVSLALVLLIGSALLIRTCIALSGVGPGFDAHSVLTLEMSLTGDRFQRTAGVAELSRNGRNRLNAIPGVETSACGYWLPIRVDDALPFQIIGRLVDRDRAHSSRWMSISPGYLSVFKITVLRGRDFTDADTAATPGVVLINHAFAKQYWPEGDPVGQQIIIGKGMGQELREPARTIIGVVGDTHNAGLGRPPGPMAIVPVAQVTDGYAAAYSDVQPILWMVRTHDDPHRVIAAVTEQLRLASEGFPVGHIRTMDEAMVGSTARESFRMLLLTIFGAVALVLAAVGIYGIMAYSVQQRIQEMGIRMALGADQSSIRKLMVWYGMRPAIIGLALGIAAAFGFTRLITSFLFGVKSWDPAVFLSASLILTAVTLVAVWLPAMRAAKVDPIRALRME